MAEQLDILLTAAFGLEAVVRREASALGYEAKVIQPGRLLVRGDLEAVARLNVWVRTAERVLIRVGDFKADDFGLLFDGTHELPWDRWISADATFPVRGRSVKSQLSSVPACQRMVKKAIVEQLRKAHGVEELPESGPTVGVEVALLNDHVTLTIDTSGSGLHKRGYRPVSGPAPLRETLASALVQLSFWRPDRPLADPFCGTGTIAIEAAMIGRNIAPGLNRAFAAESWPGFDSQVWDRTRQEAREKIGPALPLRIRAMDIHGAALGMARVNAENAGVAEDIHFHQKPFSELTSKREYGCVITNPPYGHRMGTGATRDAGTDEDIEALYRSMPMVLRSLPTWSHYIFTGFSGLERVFGRSADRRRKLYNGRIECCYYQFHGPRPGADKPPARDERASTETSTDLVDSDAEEQTSENTASEIDSAAPQSAAESSPSSMPSSSPSRSELGASVFGGLLPEAKRQADEFANRLRKRARHLRRWPGRGITCYRLYERDIPEIPLVVDRYEDSLHIAEFARPHQRTPAQHADWLEMMQRTAAESLDIKLSNVHLKFRDRQRGTSQYERTAKEDRRIVVQESGLKFEVNLSDYIDTGLFLDHRLTRQRVREMADGKRMLNLFAYTGAFSVYAAAGGAESTTTVDLSRTYLDWAERNLQLNELGGPRHQRVQSDAIAFLERLPKDEKFDLMVVDPPTFSNSKRTEEDWDVQRDQSRLFPLLRRNLAPGGTLFFSTNFRRFKFDATPWAGCDVREISNQTVPEDFRNRRIHRCWIIREVSKI